mgnify:CR=1 FL=1
MIVSTILLTRDNHYVDDNGNLPDRPTFDKPLLTGLCKNQEVSQDAYDMLPPSIRQIVRGVTEEEPTIGITIPEIDGLTDLLIVSRSNGTIYSGKKFRFNNFKLLANDMSLEIWKRK